MGQIMRYFKGQVLPLEYDREIQIGVLDQPMWYVFQTKPQRERPVQVWLERKGLEAWFPTEKAYRRIPQGKIRKVEYDRTIVPRYVFARFTGHPKWLSIIDGPLGRLHLTGIAGHAGRPFRITDQEFEEMTTLPKRILEKRMQAEKAKIVSVGDRVEVIDGPMKGWIVDVCEMKGKIATMLIPILGERKVQIDLDRLRKIERA